ncbi:MAG TPA: oligosaccharide flippase family protein [Solirubrobacteraceae bacterium]|nr:oligosaccharide flippase family protein [Solirubrobacteraceae bacterium]
MTEVTEAPLNAPEAVDILDTSAAGSHVVRGGTARVVSYVVGILVSIIGAALMLRHLGVGDFGRYTTATSLIVVVAAMSDLGLTGVSVRHSAIRDASDRASILRNLLGLRLAISAVGIVVMCGFGLAVGYPSVEVAGIALAGVALLIQVTFSAYCVPLQLGLRLSWSASLELLRQVGQTITVVILVLLGASLLPFTGAMIPGALAAAAIAGFLIRHTRSLVPVLDRRQWLILLRELVPYAAAAGIGALYFRVAIVVLSLVAGAEQTGLFGAAFRVTEVVVGIPWLVATSALPVLARAASTDRGRLTNALQRMFVASLTVGVGIAMAIFLGAQFALTVVAGSQFHGSVDVLRVQSVTVVFTFMVTQWGLVLLALEHRRALLVVNLIGLAVAIVVAIVLGHLDGARGASVALVVAEATVALGYGWSMRALGDDLRVRLGAVPRILAAAGVGIGVSVVVPATSLVQTVIGCAIYVLVLALSGGIPPEARELIPKSLRFGARVGHNQ